MRWPTRREIWIAAVIMAAILAWTGRFFVNPDGISYLDLSDDFAAGRWSDAINAHWSPGYPALLAFWLVPFRSGSAWESTAVHVLNGLLFLAALRSFEFFLREVNRSRTEVLSSAVTFASYTVVLWCLLVLITVRSVTQDMMLAAIGFLIAGLFVRIQSRASSARPYVVFGVLLGVAALTKSFMFGVSILMLVVSMIGARKVAGSLGHHLIAAAVFATVVAPQLAAVSMRTG